MTVLSRGARVRRGGRRPGWVLLTVLLVLAIGASSALVFTNRVELLKLAVILALWAAVAGAFVSVLYRRQSDADQSRVRDLKLVYDLQLDREIAARREYELTVESQLRRELASELRAQAADDLAELRAELSALRTSLEILFDTDLAHRPALGGTTPEAESQPERAYSEWDRNGENPRDTPVDWVTSDRVTAVPPDNASRSDDAIIDVPEEPLIPPRQQPPPRQDRVRHQYEAPQDPAYAEEPAYADESAYAQPGEPRFEPPPQPAPPPAAQFQTEPQSEPEPQAAPEPAQEARRQAHWPGQGWQPAGAAGQWLPPGAPGSNWAGADAPGESAGGRRRARHSGVDEAWDGLPVEPVPPPPYGDSSRRAWSRHSAEYRDYGVPNLSPGDEGSAAPPPAAATPPPASPALPGHPASPGGAPPPPRLAPPPAPEQAPRHGGDPEREDPDGAGERTATGGQSVADLLARLQVQPSEGGRRRRRES